MSGENRQSQNTKKRRITRRHTEASPAAQKKSYPEDSILYACAGLGDNEAIIKVNEEEKYFTLNIGNNDIEPNETKWIEKIKKLGIKVDEAETDESLQKLARDCTCGIVYFDGRKPA
jgi:hypothetical protein